MKNIHPADRLAIVRYEISLLQQEEACVVIWSHN